MSAAGATPWPAFPCVMGIVNVTPDSFSDGGLSFSAADARARIDAIAVEGARIADVGAESTRPGSARVPPDEQRRRLAPVIDEIVARPPGIRLSVDTTHACVARAMLDAGATIINDVSAGREDPDMLPLAAERGVGVVLMHMRGQPADMQSDPRYDDVVGEVYDFLARRAEAALGAGVAGDHIALDPGIGFGKTLPHNLALLRALPRLAGLGHPLLVGLSRKGMIGEITGRALDQRAAGSVAGALAACARGAHMVRVHDVAATVDALAVWQAIGEGT